MTLHPKYRSDIDGLRAIAVLAVVAFHAFPKVVTGGFTGVDIFFVISGFLISTILYENLEHQQFSFVDFYSRRIRRIFPALILVLICCFALGWFVLLPDEYKQLGKHMAGGAGFMQNWVLWNEADYFDNIAETKPLLHLWSLGIEEQFYIVWPVLLWVAYRLRTNLLALTLVIGLISFGLNIYGVKDNGTGTFYSPQTRFWELLIGATLAYLTLHKSLLVDKWKCLSFSVKHSQTRHHFYSLVGAALLVAGAVLINKKSLFPGWWALLPTLGSALILAAGPDAWFNRAVLSNKILTWFGLISYPLYLWHWALLSFARIMEGETPNEWVRAGLVLLSIVLAALTYYLIEKPIRFGKHQQIKTILLIIVMTIVGGVGYNTNKREGLGFRALAQANKEFKILSFSNPENNMTLGPNDKILATLTRVYPAQKSKGTIVVWGDSFASSWSPVIQEIGFEKDYTVVTISAAGCPPILGARRYNPPFPALKIYCIDGLIQRKAIDYITSLKPRKIIYTGSWSGYSPVRKISFLSHKDMGSDVESTQQIFSKYLPVTLEELSNISTVIVFKDWPLLLKPLRYGIDRVWISKNQDSKSAVSYGGHLVTENFINDLFEKINKPSIIYFDPSTKICSNYYCDIRHKHMRLYLNDGHHPSKYAVFLYKDELIKLLNLQ